MAFDNSEISGLSLSKGSLYEEMTMTQAALDDSRLQVQVSLSNEQIHKDDKILNTYTVLDDAISGGMGSVWRVHHESWNTDLAMKRPQPRFFAEGGDARKAEFISECENWINLGLHPNIVSCYYVREIGGIPSIFSEWMDNGSVKDRINDGSLYGDSVEIAQERILDIAIQSARGLEYSHDNGLIHQDIKPSNILLSNVWDAKLADFGLAKAVAIKEEVLPGSQKTIESRGYTLGYCPQEQIDGEEPAYWMDIYAWSLTILEMYAGERLWSKGEEAKNHLKEYFSKCSHAVPREIQEILALCIQGKLNSIANVEERLTSVYWNITGREYHRKKIKTVSDTALSLNNRALSFLDLGRGDKAEELWTQSLINDSNCVDALFNRELYLVRTQRKYDFQAIQEINRNPVAAKSHAAEAIAEEWNRNNPVFPIPDAYRIPGEANSAVRVGEMLYFTVGDTNDPKKHLFNPYLISVKYDCPSTAQIDHFEDVVAREFHILKIFVSPNAKFAILILSNLTVCLYDLTQKHAMKYSEITLVEFMEALNRDDFPGAISPGGTSLVLWRDFFKGVLIINIPSLEAETNPDMRFVCFDSEGNTLLRGSQYLNESDSSNLEESDHRMVQPVFFRMDQDGKLQEIFRSEPTWRCDQNDAHEFRIGRAPIFFYKWGWNEAEKRYEPFCLDERFDRKVVHSELFLEDGHDYKVRFYDPLGHILYSEITYPRLGNKFAVWDWNKQVCLFTSENTAVIPAANRLYEKSTDDFITWQTVEIDGVKYIQWSSRASSPKPEKRKEAKWRLSRFVATEIRIREEERLLANYYQFRECCSLGKYHRALEIFKATRDIPGFSFSAAGMTMETVICAIASKTAVRKVSRMKDIPDWPFYAYNNLHRAQQLNNGFYAFPLPEDAKNTRVGIFRPDGKQIRTLTLNGISRAYKVFIRNGKVFVFDSMLSFLVFDLFGNLLSVPDGGWPVLRKHVVNENNVYYPKLFDLDPTGTHLLYGIGKDEDPYGNHCDTGFFQKDLLTGNTIRLDDFDFKMDSYQGYGYLADGTILIRHKHKIARRSPKNGKLLEYWNLDNNRKSRINISFSLERDKVFLIDSDDEGKLNWYGYCMNGKRFFMEKNSSFIHEAWCPGGRFLAMSGGERVVLRDMETGTIVFEKNTGSNRAVRMRPDGRELYIESSGKTSVNVYRVEYEYGLSDSKEVSFPLSIADIFEDANFNMEECIWDAHEELTKQVDLSLNTYGSETNLVTSLNSSIAKMEDDTNSHVHKKSLLARILGKDTPE